MPKWLPVGVVGSPMVVAPVVANGLALVVLELTEGKESTTRESERLCLGWLSCVPPMVALALWLRDVGCFHWCERPYFGDVHRCERLCPCRFWNSQRERASSRNGGNGIRNKGIATPLPLLVAFAESVHGCERVAVGVVGSAMSVAPIAATSLPLVALELTEGTESARRE